MAFDRRETAILLAGDFVLLVASLWAALLIRNLDVPSLGYFWLNFVPFVPVFLLALMIFYIAGLYEKPTRPIRRVMGARILGAQAATVAIAAILFFILPLSIAPKTILVLYLAVSVITESSWRFHRMRREMKEENRVPAVLIASGPAAQELFDEVNGNGRLLIRFVEWEESGGPARVELRSEKGTTILDFTSLYEEIFDRVPLDRLDTDQILESVLGRHVWYDGAKRLFDLVLALLGSIIAVPFIFIAVIALLAGGGGAPFIRHERVGKGNRTFRIVKLRSMLFNDHGDPELQKKNRVTALGRILRKTRIDELPQLWNILAGDLSFIGPRPELPAIARVYEREIPAYGLRHLIAPGLSGWAQIHDTDPPKGGADIPRTRRKLSFDLYYLKHRSFALDLAVALKTLRTLLSFSGT